MLPMKKQTPAARIRFFSNRAVKKFRLKAKLLPENTMIYSKNIGCH